MISPPARAERPAQSLPPLNTDKPSPAARAVRTADCTSEVLRQRTTAIGCAGVAAFHIGSVASSISVISRDLSRPCACAIASSTTMSHPAFPLDLF
jgi:hypothetical protein